MRNLCSIYCLQPVLVILNGNRYRTSSGVKTLRFDLKLKDIVNENEQKSESRVVKQSSRNFRSLGSKSEEGRREVCLFISYLSFKGQLKSSTL